jgi:hypothetical protein
MQRGDTYIELLSPDGDLTFMNNKRVMAFQVGGMRDISSTLGKAYYYNAMWYFTIGNTLFKFQSNVVPDAVTNDTLAVIMNTAYQFKKNDFVSNFGPSPLISVRITTLPLHGTLTKNGTPVVLNEVVTRNDLDKLAYQPNNGFAAIDTIGWNGFNGLAYASSGGLLKLLIISPPSKPAITGVLASYCNNLGAQKLKISNWPSDAGTSVSAKLDAAPLTVNAADSSVTFNVNGLTAGAHSVTVAFTNMAGAKDTVANFQITATVTPEVNLGANITHVTNLTTQVVVTATNAAGGGTIPLYTFASNRTFTNVLQAEGASAVLNINPVNLIVGENKIYVRTKTSATCYTVQTNVDSIVISRDAATGIIDPNNAGQVITVFPNPFGATITIKGLNSGKRYGVVIYNARGQAIYTGEVKNKQVMEIPAGGIKPGVYWLTLYDEKKKPLGSEKIVKY